MRLEAMKQLMQEREIKGERETIRKVPTTQYNKYRNLKVHMHEMHEHVTCKYKYIMGSAQPKPTSIQHCNKVNTHLNA